MPRLCRVDTKKYDDRQQFMSHQRRVESGLYILETKEKTVNGLINRSDSFHFEVNHHLMGKKSFPLVPENIVPQVMKKLTLHLREMKLYVPNT